MKPSNLLLALLVSLLTAVPSLPHGGSQNGKQRKPNSGVVRSSRTRPQDKRKEIKRPVQSSQPDADTPTDESAPVISILSPAAGSVIDGDRVTIRGHVRDRSLTIVKINGQTATVDANGLFTVQNVPLKHGENEVTVEATNAAGDVEEIEIVLIGRDVTSPAPPTVFAVTSPTRLDFQTVEGRAQPESKIAIRGGADTAVTEAASGTGLFAAVVKLKLGPGVLNVTASDEGGTSQPVLVPIESHPQVTPLPAGKPWQINIASGNTQRAIISTPFPEPATAIVTDSKGDPVAAVTVRFSVVHGTARFEGGSLDREVKTDERGQARVRVQAGKEPGIELIRASFAGNQSSVATFEIETVRPVKNAPTEVSGVVLDEYKHPLGNIFVRVAGKAVRTGADGRFVVRDVRPGPHRAIEVEGQPHEEQNDGRTAAHYFLDVLNGVDNNLGRPIFLTKLGEGLPIPADEGGLVEPQTGLAWPVDRHKEPIGLVIQAGSRVTLPSATADKRLFIAMAGDDRVPVSLDEGRWTNLYLFISPDGIMFDKPLRVTLPNIDKLAPGSDILVMKFDVKSGRYVKVGVGGVSEDGEKIEVRDDSRILSGGWYAFPRSLPGPDITDVDFMDIEHDARLDGKVILNLETWSGAKRAVLMSSPDSPAKKLYFRASLPRESADALLTSENGMPIGMSSEPVEVTMTPTAIQVTVGGCEELIAAGRPGPGGYYTWSIADPSVVSLRFASENQDSEHPNKVIITGLQRGRTNLTVTYRTVAGETSTATADVVCR